MKYDDRRRLLGLTWIGWLNLIALQWVGLRLAAVVEPPDDVQTGWTVKRWWPLEGWRGVYKVASVGVAVAMVVLVAWAVRS